MKAPVLIIASVVLILFVAISLLKEQPNAFNSEDDGKKLTAEDKARIQGFWEIYRQAREQRLAGQLGEAHKSYESALTLNPDHEDALYYLGNVSLLLGYPKQAQNAWKRLAKVNTKSTRAHFQLGDLYLNIEYPKLFNTEKAEAQYRLALEINKEESAPHLRLGHVALIRGDMQKAVEHFDDVIGSNFTSVEAYFLKGYVAWKEGHEEDALTFLKSARKYSKPIKPVQGVLGEGDTKPGGLIQQLDLSEQGSMFFPYFANISETAESDISPKTMADKYLRLNRFLEEIKKIKRS